MACSMSRLDNDQVLADQGKAQVIFIDIDKWVYMFGNGGGGVSLREEGKVNTTHVPDLLHIHRKLA